MCLVCDMLYARGFHDLTCTKHGGPQTATELEVLWTHAWDGEEWVPSPVAPPLKNYLLGRLLDKDLDVLKKLGFA